ncbi:DHHA1 domain-containing protein [Labrenzia sp. 011]|uniref:DHHA1 domain-containing protein n=1 Tax=Labrenzia sp. 011 TaxID=2171494 RepID=UPI001FCAC8F7|nr:DHHA1 domain-containing protein [Labrenzia sp. 011]
MEKELADARKKLAMGGGSGEGAPVKDAGRFKLMARTVEGINPKDLKGMADEAKTQLGSGVVVLISVADDGKAAIVTAVTKDLTEAVSAVDLVRIGSEALGGRGGGGRPDMAQAGGPDGARADVAISAIEAHLAGL